MPALHKLPANVLTKGFLASLPNRKHGDGGGLWLLKRPDGGAQWSFRYTVHKRAREMGLGSAGNVTLASARKMAARWRAVVAEGKDPQVVRERETAEAAAERPTLEMVARDAFEARKSGLKDEGVSARWLSPLTTHIFPKIGSVPISDLTQQDIASALKPIWQEKPDSAKKGLSRIRIALIRAAAMGLDVDMQAADKARALLGAQRHESKHIPSMPWQDVPAFFDSLSGDTMGERALKLLILTGCRSGEVRGLRLDEIQGNLWVIPAARMKAGREFRVPLSDAALAVIEESLPFARGQDLFPGQSKSQLSDVTLLAIMRRRGLKARPHGFRTSLRTWLAETTDTPREVAEACLAHIAAGKVEQAYRRTDFLERRRVLMDRWAEHVVRHSDGRVIQLGVKA